MAGVNDKWYPSRLLELFEPDVLIPTQFYVTRRTYHEPEKMLMFAVLEDAIETFQKYSSVQSGRKKILFEEARNWIMDDDSLWLFSFRNVCEILGLDYKFLRKGLLKWEAKNKKADTT